MSKSQALAWHLGNLTEKFSCLCNFFAVSELPRSALKLDIIVMKRQKNESALQPLLMSQSRRLPPKKDRKAFGKKKRYVNLCMCAWPRHKSRNLWRRLQALRAIDVLKEICRGFGSDCRSKGWMTARNVIKHKNAVRDLQTKLWKLLDFANTVQYFALLTQTSKTSVFHFCFAISRPKTFSPSVPHREKGRSIIHHHVPSASRVIARDMVWHDEAPNTSLLVMSYYLSCTMQVVLFHGVNLNQIFVVYRCVQLVFLSYHLDSVALKYHFRFHFVASFRLSEIGGQVKAQTTAGSGGGDDRWRASNWHCQLSN